MSRRFLYRLGVCAAFPGWAAASEDGWDPLIELAAEILILLLAVGGVAAERVADLREDGDPVLPVVRFDAGVLTADAGRWGWDLGGEVGHGLLGADVRYSRFLDSSLEDDRLLIQSHFLYRMAVAETLDVGLGVGGAWERGLGHGQGVSFTAPVRFWPTDRAGVVLRPCWTSFDDRDVSDVELSLLLKYEFWTLQAGYRWLDLGEETDLQGGFRVGAGFRY